MHLVISLPVLLLGYFLFFRTPEQQGQIVRGLFVLLLQVIFLVCVVGGLGWLLFTCWGAIKLILSLALLAAFAIGLASALVDTAKRLFKWVTTYTGIW